MQIETVATAKLVPYARNSRTHSEAQVAQIAASIREFGFTNPVLIDTDGGIIAGHGRVLAARQLGQDKVPCIRLEHLTETQKRAYIIADNKLALNAGWDEAMLALEFRDLLAAGYDVGLTGYELPEIDELVAGLDATPEGKTDPDACPPIEVEAVSKIGDLWVMGNHRLMCGDSTSAEAVALLMNGKKALVMNTDPPYGIAYDSSEVHANGKDHGAIKNDEIDGEKLQAFLEQAIRAAVPHLEPSAAFYLWHPMLTQGTFFAAAAAAAAVLIHRQIIWIKPVLVFGRGDYHWKHELCFYGWRRGTRPAFYGPRNQTTVWEIASVTHAERKEFKHATPKPVELFTRPLENHTKPGEICYEPFSGTGPQIIAAEKLARRCFAMELHPQHVDVGVRRWQQFTGKRAVHSVTGQPFPG